MPAIYPRVVLVVDFDDNATPDKPLLHNHKFALETYSFDLRMGPRIQNPTYPDSATGTALVHDPNGNYDPSVATSARRKVLAAQHPAFIYVEDKRPPDWTLRWAGLAVLDPWRNKIATFKLFGWEYFNLQQPRLFPRFNTEDPSPVIPDVTVGDVTGLTWVISPTGLVTATATISEPDATASFGPVIFEYRQAGVADVGWIEGARVPVAERVSATFGPIQPNITYQIAATLNLKLNSRAERTILWRPVN